MLHLLPGKEKKEDEEESKGIIFMVCSINVHDYLW